MIFMFACLLFTATINVDSAVIDVRGSTLGEASDLGTINMPVPEAIQNSSADIKLSGNINTQQIVSIPLDEKINFNSSQSINKKEYHENDTNNDIIGKSNGEMNDDSKSEEQQIWKISSFYMNHNDSGKDEKSIQLLKEKKPEGKEFKPSPLLNSYYDLDKYFNPLNFKKPKNFLPDSINYYKNENLLDLKKYKTSYNHNKIKFYEEPALKPKPNIENLYFKENFNLAPYHYKKIKHSIGSIEHIPKNKEIYRTKPFSEHSDLLKPAGGLYKFPFPDDFKYPSSDVKNNFYEPHHLHRKKMNPWNGLVQMVTTFLPVGLLVSALTPSVVTVNSQPTASRVTTLTKQ